MMHGQYILYYSGCNTLDWITVSIHLCASSDELFASIKSAFNLLLSFLEKLLVFLLGASEDGCLVPIVLRDGRGLLS